MMDIVRDVLLLVFGVPPSSPQRLVIEATNQCNRACHFCGAAQEDLARGFMSWDLFLRLAEDAAKLRPAMVSLHAHGEPLLHPRIVDMVRELHDRGLAIEIVTNGDLLTPELSERLLTGGLTRLVISHPAITPENWLDCRGVEYHRQIDAGLQTAVDVWHESGREVVLRCLFFAKNVSGKGRNLAGYLRRWLERPAVSAVEFWLYQPWPRHVLEEQIRYLYRNPKICRHAIGTLSVSWKGVITPCSYDVRGDLAIGECDAVSLTQVYSSHELRQFTKQTMRRSRKRPELCRKCLVNRVSVHTVGIEGADYRRVHESERDMWLRERGRNCWLQLFSSKASTGRQIRRRGKEGAK